MNKNEHTNSHSQNHLDYFRRIIDQCVESTNNLTSQTEPKGEEGHMRIKARDKSKFEIPKKN